MNLPSDFSGAFMSLGINRDMPGDIPAGNNSAVHVCLDSVTGFIINELDRTKTYCCQMPSY